MNGSKPGFADENKYEGAEVVKADPGFYEQTGGSVSEYDITPTKHGIKLMLNGFPKSGLHLLGLMCTAFVSGIQDEMVSNLWSGINGAWALEPLDLNDRLFKFSRINDGQFVFSHSVCNERLVEFLWYSGIGIVFLYRDPRDVAVSQTYHVLSEDDTCVHAGKELYRALGSFDDALAAVITGIDRYPGVMDRWESYRGWLEIPWVLSVRFEDLRTESVEWSKTIFIYALNRVAMMFGKRVEIEPESLEQVAQTMIEHGDRTELSSTFRKGRIGDWRETFTPRHVELFKQSDEHDRLAAMDYHWR